MKSVAMLLSTVLLLAPALAVAQAPKPYEIEDFVRESKFKEVAVSPKGTYVAIAVPEEAKTVMYILKTGERKPLTRVDVSGRKSHVYDITWVSDHRLLYSVAVKDQLDERPVQTGETWAIEADGSKRIRIGGFYGVQILDTLDDDDDHIIATIYTGGDGFTKMARLDVYGGAEKRLAEAPIRYGWFMADSKQEARFAGGEDKQDMKRLYWRKPGSDKWVVINDQAATKLDVVPIGISADDKTAYLQTEEPAGPDSILAFDVETGTSKRIVHDDDANPAGLINAIGKRTPIGVYYAGATPRYVYFDPDSEDAKAHQRLQKAFPGMVVRTSRYTTAKREVLVYVYSDREPGGYYVMNLDTRRVAPMMFAADWLEPERLAPTRDFFFKARDGRRIPAFLTVPVGSSGKQLPMVVHPHGGPYAADDWGYDPEVQVLAAHGYAVLQVNFRGSTGYGLDHETAGYRQWGLAMQDDLTDATRWAIDQGIADPARICIFGASYGGYASLMGVAKEPGLYKCAVGQVGVYDLNRMRSDDSLGNDYLRHYHEKVMNTGDLAAVSPTRLADRIKVPVFITSGHLDERLPIAQSETMEAALRKAGVPVETLYFKTEGHGIYKREHRAEFYARLLAFLQRNIGGRAPVPMAGAGVD